MRVGEEEGGAEEEGGGGRDKREGDERERDERGGIKYKSNVFNSNSNAWYGVRVERRS